MKYLISLLVICLGAGCASRKEAPQKAISSVPGTGVPQKRTASVRTPEVVKVYSAGRYTDPNYPDEMHERHTVYRREEAPDWNYLPDPPIELPLGPSAGKSSTTQSYYAKTEGELNAQQRAYADALQEQNRAMKKRIESLQQETGKIPELQQEIDLLKKRVDDTPQPPSAPSNPESKPEDDAFSYLDPELPTWNSDELDSGPIGGITDSDEQTADHLLAQMRQNDEYAAKLATAERQRISSVISRSFPRPISLAVLKR